MKYSPRIRTSAYSLDPAVSQWGHHRAPIKSIQYGEIELNGVTSNTATITAVVTANSVVLPLGLKTASGGTNSGVVKATMVLTNSTTVTATSGSNTAVSRVFRFCVLEFTNGTLRSNQSGTITLAGVNTNTATITSVVTANCWLLHQGELSTANEADLDAAKLTLTNATTVTADRSLVNAASMTVAYTVVEFLI